METFEFYRLMGWMLFTAFVTIINAFFARANGVLKLFSYLLLLVGILAMLALLATNFISMYI